MPPLLIAIPGDIVARSSDPTLSGVFGSSRSMAAGVAAKLTTLSGSPTSGNARDEASRAINEKAFLATALGEYTTAAAIADADSYRTIVPPATFIASQPEQGYMGIIAAVDLLWDSLSSGQKATWTQYFTDCNTAWEPGLDAMDLAFKPSPDPTWARRSNWTPLFCGSFGAAVVGGRINNATWLQKAEDAVDEWLSLHIGADGDPVTTHHYHTLAAMRGIFFLIWKYGTPIYNGAGPDYLDYLEWASLPSSGVRGLKMVGRGDTTPEEPGFSDIPWWHGGQMANLFKGHPAFTTWRPIVGCCYAPASNFTPATPGGSSAIVTKDFPTSGEYVWRQKRNDPEDFFLSLYYRPENGPGHGHAEHGGFVFNDLDVMWTGEGGGLTNGVNSPKLGTDHSQVIIDGKGTGFAPHNGSKVSEFSDSLYARARFDLKKAYDFETASKNTPTYTLDADGLWARSWNTVQKAFRNVAVVKRAQPYWCLYDDIRKDNASHSYVSQILLAPGVEATILSATEVELSVKQGAAPAPGVTLKLIQAGNGAQPLNVTPGQIYAIGHVTPQVATNWRFTLTYANDATQDVFPWAGDSFGLGAHYPLNQAISQVKRLTASGYPCALIDAAVATPSGWNVLPMTRLNAKVRIFKLGGGTFSIEDKVFTETPTTNNKTFKMLKVTQTAVEPDLRLLFIPRMDGDEIPNVTPSATGATVTWAGGEQQVFVFGGSAGIQVSTGGITSATKRWTFTGSSEGLADGANTADITVSHNATDNALQFSSTRKGSTRTEFARRALGQAETWQAWGVPAGATVQSVRISGWQQRVTANFKLASHSVKLRIIGSGGTSIISGDLISSSLNVDVSESLVSMPAGATQTVNGGSQAPGTSVRLEVEYTSTLTGGGGSPAAFWLLDNIDLEITWTLPPLAIELGESLSLSDARVLGIGLVENQPLSFSDQQAKAFSKSLTDTVNLVDGLVKAGSLVFGEALSVSDAAFFDIAMAMGEALGVSDSATFEAAKVLADALGLGDEAEAILGTALILALEESLEIIDSHELTAEAVLAESFSLVDERVLELGLYLADALGIEDDVSAQVVGALVLVLAESLALTDQGVNAFDLALGETIALTDGLALEALKSFTESLSLSDARTLAISLTLTQDMSLADAIRVFRQFLSFPGCVRCSIEHYGSLALSVAGYGQAEIEITDAQELVLTVETC